MQKMRTFRVTPLDQQQEIFNPNSEICPFNGYIGNAEAVRIAMRIAKKAFGAFVDIGLGSGQWHKRITACSREYPIRMLLTGPRSVGKTTFAKAFAKLIGTNYDSGTMEMPWAEVDATAIKQREDVLEKIVNAWKEAGVPLVSSGVVIKRYMVPPGFLFIDEIHRLPRKVMEGLLKMTEPNDGMFEVGNSIIDCRRMTILSGTTDPGKLLETIKSRFPVRIALRKHTTDEIATIIQNATNWPRDAAMRLAKMKPIPREALGIAKLIQSAQDTERVSLNQAVSMIAADLNLEEGGLTARAVAALSALAESPSGLSKKNLCACLENMDPTEFEQEIIPLLLKNEFHPAYITISSRHKITDAGMEELERRGIMNQR